MTVEAAAAVENVTTSVTPPAPTATSADWFESLTPEQKTDKHLLPLKGKPLSEAFRSYTEAQKVLSGSIRLPKPESTPEEKAKFYHDIWGKLGRPDAPDKYGLEAVNLPQGSPWNAESEKQFLAVAHGKGLNVEQAKGIRDWYASEIAKGLKAREEQEDRWEAEIKREWGNDYEQKIAQSNRVLEEVGGKELVQLLADRVGNHPLLLRFLAAVADPLAEQKVITSDVPGETTDDAKAKLQAIFNDKAHPYHKGDPKAAEEVLALTRKAQGAAGRKIIATWG